MNEEIILNVEQGQPYMVGARAYVEQTEDGAVITIIDKDGTTTATVNNGADGVGISSVTLNGDYTLTINYSDGTSVTTASIRGETGASGVYCGTEEPLDPAIEVWVDPSNGDSSVLKVKDESDNWATIETIVGEPAGFGTVTATVDTNVGTPAVVVTSSGDDTAKNFAFQFKNLGYDDSDLLDDFADLASDFGVLQGQFDTAVAAVTTDTEVTDIRVGADGVTDTTAGASVRRQFSALNAKFDGTRNILNVTKSTIGIINSSGNVAGTSGRTSDFIPCEAEVKYYGSQNYGVPTSSFPYVVGYYNSSKTFLSRFVNNGNPAAFYFTTPENCAYIRVSLRTSSDSFSKDKQLTKGGVYPYRCATEVLSETKDSQTVGDTRLRVFGITDADKQPMYITAENKWAFSNNYHVSIPIKEGDSISIVANNSQPTVWAMLKSDKWAHLETPDLVATYDLEVDDEGNLDWQPIVDGGGDPIIDTRHAINAKQSQSFIAVPDSQFLYLMLTDGTNSYLPKSLTINGMQYIADEKPSSIDKQSYETILFDDFDTFNTNIWKRLTSEPQEQGRYNSRFYTTADNAWCEQSMLVLKCYKPDETIDLGTYIDQNGDEQPCEYVAPYISSEDSYVIPDGKISARIKFGQKMEKHYPCCFWTFGQGALWGYAHEMDIMETSCDIQSGSAVSQNGTTVTDGSIKNILGNHTHTKDSNADNVMTSYYYNISANIKSGGTYSSETELSNKLINIDVTEWHEYSVIWNADSISYFVDGIMTNTVNASAIGAVNENGVTGFTHPQDIRFNIKAEGFSDGDEAEIFVDWVKVERLTKTPALSIAHADVALAVGNSMYINPTFNADCSNMAFTVDVEGDAVQYEKYLSDSSKMVVHKLIGASAGASTITIKSANGVTMDTFTVTVS